MRNRNRWMAAGTFLLGVGITLTIADWARSQRPAPPAKPPAPTTLKGQIAAATKLEEADVDKVLRELAPAIAARLASGEQVELPGLGVFRVVRVPEHRDLVDGRPAIIRGANYVEFRPAAVLNAAANAPTAVPAEVVPPFQYNPLPGQTPGQRVPDLRVVSPRVR